MTREILKQALEALESDNPYLRQLASNAIRNALEQPVQEPVGKVIEIGDNGFKCEFNRRLAVGTKLYTAPPLPVQAEYDKTEMNSFVIDLYEEKMREGKHGHYEALFHCVHRAIEAAHGIKEQS